MATPFRCPARPPARNVGPGSSTTEGNVVFKQPRDTAMRYDLPAQGLSIDLRCMPAIPASRLVDAYPGDCSHRRKSSIALRRGWFSGLTR